MALLYLDASAAIPLFVREAQTDRVREFLRPIPPVQIAISNWVTTEIAGALSTMVRNGALDLELRHAAAAQWQSLRHGFTLLPIADEMFERAALLAGRPTLGLRAADALHVAIAQSAACELVTFDVAMAKAAREIGVAVASIGPT